MDVVLLALVLLGWWQLRGGSNGPDAVRVVAPVACVVGTAVVAVRWLTPLLSLASRPAVRSRSLVVPLAVLDAARRPLAVTAATLLAVAAAAATFGVSLHATWERSQREQAALQVGTDLALALDLPVSAEESTQVAATGRTVSPVTARPVALGRFVGAGGAPPTLVAVDARRAGALLRGHLDGGRTWQQVVAPLVPTTEVTGPAVPAGLAGVRVGGRGPAGTRVTPSLVVQDGSGLRTSVVGDPVDLDGEPHALRWRGAPSAAGSRLVAVELALTAAPVPVPDDLPGDDPLLAPHAVTVDVRLPGTAPAGDWSVRDLGDDPSQAPARVTARPAGSGTVVRASTAVVPLELQYSEVDLFATSFDAPSGLPVVISQALADAVGDDGAGPLSATVGTVDVPLEVVGVVPTVPSAVGRLAVLADEDTLSRLLVARGRLDPVVDAWWVADPAPTAAARLRALRLGEVTSRAETERQLARGPLRVSLVAALVLLVGAAVLLLLAGAVLLLVGDLELRAVELARLRALGLTRRQLLGLVVTQHGVLLSALVLLGALLGAGAAFVLAPPMVRSDVAGVLALPVAVRWPWGGEVLLVAALLLALVVVTLVVGAVQVRRADAAHLRTGVT